MQPGFGPRTGGTPPSVIFPHGCDWTARVGDACCGNAPVGRHAPSGQQRRARMWWAVTTAAAGWAQAQRVRRRDRVTDGCRPYASSKRRDLPLAESVASVPNLKFAGVANPSFRRLSRLFSACRPIGSPPGRADELLIRHTRAGVAGGLWKTRRRYGERLYAIKSQKQLYSPLINRCICRCLTWTAVCAAADFLTCRRK